LRRFFEVSVSVVQAPLPFSKGSLFRELVSLAWPITVSTLSFTVKKKRETKG